MHWEDKEILSAENSGNTLHAVKLKDAPPPKQYELISFHGSEDVDQGLPGCDAV